VLFLYKTVKTWFQGCWNFPFHIFLG
jgi:hypothetical protein